MNNPELFSKCNILPRRDAKELLEINSFKIKWKKVGDRSLDIGSADGGVTCQILRKYLPENYSILIGCDISEKMVLYANKKYGDNRTHFINHDIRNDIPRDMRGAFDHVFSFYTLNWVQDQRDVMSKIYTMLDNEGDCLLLIAANSPIFEVYRLLSKQPKWISGLFNFKEIVSPYQSSLEPEKDLQLIMEDIGFKNINVTCQHRSYLFEDVNVLKDVIESICTFQIPKELMKEYLDDFVQTAVKHQVMEEVTDENGKFLGLNYVYTILWVYGSKV